MVVAFRVPRAWLRSAALGVLCCAAALTSCDFGSAASSRKSSADSTTRSGEAISPPVRADRLHTDSAAQTATEIIGRREFAGHGVLRDGTVLTVWADGRAYDGSAGVRRAYRLQSPSGQVRTGRLPDGHPTGWGNDLDSVATTDSGFVVIGSPDVLLLRDGSVRQFRSSGGRRFQDGDVVVPATEGRVRLLRPHSRTEHARALGRDVRPLAVGAGRLYGLLNPPSSTGRPAPVLVGSWSGVGEWTADSIGTMFDLRVVANGRRAAAWVCDEGGHGYGGGSASCGSEGFSVTIDGGATWRSLDPGERPFDQVDAAVAVDGQLYVDAWPRGYWRSTDETWTAFAPLGLPRGSVLHAEDGFVSAVVNKRKRVTILRLGAGGKVADQWPVRVPAGPKPASPDYGYADMVGSGDGSVTVRPGEQRPVSRLIGSTGVVTSGRWPFPIGLHDGFLMLDRKDLEASTVLTRTGVTLRTTVRGVSDLRPNDHLLITGRRVPYLFPPTYRHEELWSFRPRDATFRKLPMPDLRPGGAVAGVVDGRGRAWIVQGRHLWQSDDNGASWNREELPHRAWPGGIEVSGPRLMVMLHSPTGDVARILGPDGRWRDTALPPTLPERTDVWLLHDGRLLIGPVGGRLWRGTSPANRHFETLPAGPIATVVTAGEVVYGLPLGPELSATEPLPLKGDWGRVWVSKDGASTWREVAD